jgi:hypothetical protein
MAIQDVNTLPTSLRQTELATPIAPAPQGPAPVAAKTQLPAPVVVPDIYAKRAEGPANAQLTGERPVTTAVMKEIADVQATRPLWGMDLDTGVEILGNPFLTIPFSTQQEVAEALFGAREQGSFDLHVPQNAVKVGADVLFEAGLSERGTDGAVLKRAVLLGTNGQLKGAACSSADDVKKLLDSSPALRSNLLARAGFSDGWDGDGRKTKIRDVALGLGGSYLVKVESQAGRLDTVRVDNFARPVLAGHQGTGIDVSALRLAAYGASA